MVERIIDDEDSLKKAEEIYSRRNGIKYEGSRKKFFSIYKFLFQVIVLLNLLTCFTLYSNRNFIFSENFLNMVNSFFQVNIWDRVNNYFNEPVETKTPGDNTENKVEQTETEENQNKEKSLENSEKELNNEIKEESYSFIKPLDGTITSFFGERVSKNPNVSGYHTGIDISANLGTKIISAMQGKVILVSDKGKYGNHLKIQKDEFITVYAHCNKIYVKEGDDVQQGQEIAEVGTTGNSTGPHLHFEIRENNEYINPCKFLNF